MMNEQKTGFTLIELLAVIVILLGIMLITVPVIMSLIKSSRENVLEKSFQLIEKSAGLYVVNELNGNIYHGQIIPISKMEKYISNLTPEMRNENIVVIMNANNFDFYYTGREKANYNNNQSLKKLIEKETSNIVKGIKINGKVVNKVIGSKIEKNTMKNYVWYSGHLWQVIETSDDYIKLVSAYSITSIPFGSTSNWNTSWVRKWLNDISYDYINYPTEELRNGSGIFYNSLSRKDILVDGDYCLDEDLNIIEETINMIDTDRKKIKSLTKIDICQNKVTDKVGLLTLEDYVYAYDGTINDYPYSGDYRKGGTWGYNFIDADELMWLITPYSVGGFKNRVWHTYWGVPGFPYRGWTGTNGYGIGVRPVISIKSDININSGTGTRTDPYILSANMPIDKGNNLARATIGEYLYINESNNPFEANQQAKENVRYRIISIEPDSSIKVQRNDVLRKLPSSISFGASTYVPYYSYKDENAITEEDKQSNWCYYESSNSTYYTGGCINQNYYKPTLGTGKFELYKGQNIGYFLNNSSNSFYNWLDNEYKNYILDTTWKLPVGSHGGDYSQRLNLSKDNGLTYPNRLYDGSVIAKIGLPQWGTILSGNDINIRYWLINRWNDSVPRTSFVFSDGEVSRAYPSYTGAAVRPVFRLDSNIVVKSGLGTKNKPYIIGK